MEEIGQRVIHVLQNENTNDYPQRESEGDKPFLKT